MTSPQLEELKRYNINSVIEDVESGEHIVSGNVSEYNHYGD